MKGVPKSTPPAKKRSNNSLSTTRSQRQCTLVNNQQLQPQQQEKEDEEELLTPNIFEVLLCDLQMYMLTFLTLKDLYHVALSCKYGLHLVLSPDTDGYLWNHLALRHCHEETTQAHMEELKMLEKVAETNTWRELVRSNMIYWDPNTRTADSDIQMHNRNKTISCEKTQDWYTIRANRKLEMGMVHCWEYTLDDHDNGSYNAFRIFAGIERSDFEFTEKRDSNIIGSGTDGIGFNMGQHMVHRDSSRTHYVKVVMPDNKSFITGDTIAMVLNLKNLTSSERACMHLFKNNEYFHTIEDIPTKGILYYPAISVIGHQRVSIRMKHSSTLDHKNVVRL